MEEFPRGDVGSLTQLTIGLRREGLRREQQKMRLEVTFLQELLGETPMLSRKAVLERICTKMKSQVLQKLHQVHADAQNWSTLPMLKHCITTLERADVMMEEEISTHLS